MQSLLLWTPGVMRSPLVPMVSLEAHRRAGGSENLKWPLWPTFVEKMFFSLRSSKAPKTQRRKPMALMPMKEKTRVYNIHIYHRVSNVLPLRFCK